MAYNLNNMARIAQVGQKLKFRDMPTLDFSGAIDDYFNSRDAADKRAQLAEQAQKQQAYSEALQTGNQDAINQAWAAYDPQGYSSYLNQQQQRAEDRQWQLEDMARKERFERNLAAIKHGYAMQTAAARGAGGDTNAIRNVAAMVEAGYTPQEAWKMYYGGQNPTLDVSQLGQKGYEVYDKKMGELMAEKAEAADLLSQFDSVYNDLFKDGGLVSRAQIGYDYPDTIEGRLQGIVARNIPTPTISQDAQTARQEIQYILGGLRLNESSVMKGALSDTEQKFLSDMVAGDVKKYSPWQIQGALNGIRNKLVRKISGYDRQTTNAPSDDDAWGGI